MCGDGAASGQPRHSLKKSGTQIIDDPQVAKASRAALRAQPDLAARETFDGEGRNGSIVEPHAEAVSKHLRPHPVPAIFVDSDRVVAAQEQERRTVLLGVHLHARPAEPHDNLRTGITDSQTQADLSGGTDLDLARVIPPGSLTDVESRGTRRLRLLVLGQSLVLDAPPA